MSESNSDLILNALALTFILELDEMFYIFFLTTEMRVIVETFTPMVVALFCLLDFFFMKI